jgi:hypothetical protein
MCSRRQQQPLLAVRQHVLLPAAVPALAYRGTEPLLCLLLLLPLLQLALMTSERPPLVAATPPGLPQAPTLH